MKKGMVFFVVLVFAVLMSLPVQGAERQPGSEKMFNPQPEPPGDWRLIQQDITSFNSEIGLANGKLAGAKPGADLTTITLMGSHGNMMNLLRSLQAKAKALQQKGGQEKGIIEDGINPKLNSLDVSLKNFKIAIQRGDRMAAQGLLNEIGGTVKALEALVAR